VSTNTKIVNLKPAKSARSYVRLALPSFWCPKPSDEEPKVEKLSKRQMSALFADDLLAGTSALRTLRSA